MDLEEKQEQLEELCLIQKNQLAEISKEITKNILIIKEREQVIQNLLKIKTNQNVQSQSVDFQSQFYIAKLELDRIRQQILCRNCNENEKEAVIVNCFHSFCQKCIDKNLNDRNRQCPICMTKFTKYDVKKLFIN